jgi:hypothetical protein
MPRRQRTSVPEELELFEDEESLPEELEAEVEDEGEAQQTDLPLYNESSGYVRVITYRLEVR